MRPSPIWVIKLGGSLFAGQNLRSWLNVLATRGRGRVVIVPGGGPFADQVRAAQKRWCFDDRTAHRMAMLGMAQYGLMLTGLQAGLTAAIDENGITRALNENVVPVWITDGAQPMSVARDWSVTSDSLAAWLAARLGAANLILVKSISITAKRSSARELTERGVIDAAFPEFLIDARYACRVVNAADHALMSAALSGGELAGVTVTSR